jgi:hypothetical protein
MTQNNNNTLLTPVGRLVQGSCFKSYDKDADGKPLTVKTGANAGQPRVQYFIALAIDKKDKGVQDLLMKMAEIARAAFPHLHDKNGNCTLASFAWKVVDGDKHPDKEGFAGCWVFRLAGGFAPKCRGADPRIILTEEGAIKRGDYIRVYISIAGNNSSMSPGLFLNPLGVQFIAFGQEIIVADDGKNAFSAAPVSTLPPGASNVPLAPPDNIFAQPQQPASPPVHATPAQPSGQVGGFGVQPHYGFLNNAPTTNNNNQS